MSLSHRYHDFSALSQDGEPSELTNQAGVDDAKLVSFEDGYKAGWEDAVKAHEGAKDKVAADFSQNLEDMSFTFHEAVAKLGLAMKPLLLQIVTKVLPELSDKTLAAHIVSQMSDMMADQAEHAIEIAVSPGNLEVLTEVVSGKTNIPFAIKSESALGDGQVYLRVNSDEREINLDAVKQGISDALDAFFQNVEQEANDD